MENIKLIGIYVLDDIPVGKVYTDIKGKIITNIDTNLVSMCHFIKYV